MHFYLSRFETMLSRYNTVVTSLSRKAAKAGNDKAQPYLYHMDMVVPTLDPGGPFPYDDKDHGYLDLPINDARRMVGFYNSFVKCQKKKLKNCRHKEVTLEMLISNVPNDVVDLSSEYDATDYEGWN
jgi:hypothetical protein